VLLVFESNSESIELDTAENGYLQTGSGKVMLRPTESRRRRM